MTYDLNDNVSESFEFTLDGFQYVMKYPTLQDIDGIEKVLNEKDGPALAVIDAVAEFITSKDPKAPNIKEVLRNKNIKVLQNFNKMIEAEFIGAE